MCSHEKNNGNSGYLPPDYQPVKENYPILPTVQVVKNNPQVRNEAGSKAINRSSGWEFNFANKGFWDTIVNADNECLQKVAFPCLELIKNFNGVQPIGTFSDNRGFHKKPYICHRCNKDGHRIKDCPESPTVGNTSYRGNKKSIGIGLCKKCGECKREDSMDKDDIIDCPGCGIAMDVKMYAMNKKKKADKRHEKNTKIGGNIKQTRLIEISMRGRQESPYLF